MWQNLRNVWKVGLCLPVGEARIAESRLSTKMLFSNCCGTYHNQNLFTKVALQRIRSMSVTLLRKSLCLSTWMFSLLNAHGNVCWNTFEVLIEGPFVSIKMLRIISCEPDNHIYKRIVQNLKQHSKNKFWYICLRLLADELGYFLFKKHLIPQLDLQGDGFVHFRNIFGYFRR